MLRAVRDPELLRWTALPDPCTAEDADRLMDQGPGPVGGGRGVELAIAGDGDLVGSTHLVFHGDWRASVAYWLAVEARGHGYATRSVRLLTRWAFETFPDLVRIELWSILGNEAADAVARRSGFVEEGVLRSRLPYRAGYRDVRCFSLVRRD